MEILGGNVCDFVAKREFLGAVHKIPGQGCFKQILDAMLRARELGHARDDGVRHSDHGEIRARNGGGDKIGGDAKPLRLACAYSRIRTPLFKRCEERMQETVQPKGQINRSCCGAKSSFASVSFYPNGTQVYPGGNGPGSWYFEQRAAVVWSILEEAGMKLVDPPLPVRR